MKGGGRGKSLLKKGKGDREDVLEERKSSRRRSLKRRRMKG
jgi:hypothetical protein